MCLVNLIEFYCTCVPNYWCLVFVEVFTYFIYSVRCHLCVWLYFVV